MKKMKIKILSLCLTFFSNKKRKSIREKYNIRKIQKTMREKIKNILIILFLYIFNFIF